jgi:hypothetical protein
VALLVLFSWLLALLVSRPVNVPLWPLTVFVPEKLCVPASLLEVLAPLDCWLVRANDDRA